MYIGTGNVNVFQLIWNRRNYVSFHLLLTVHRYAQFVCSIILYFMSPALYQQWGWLWILFLRVNDHVSYSNAAFLARFNYPPFWRHLAELASLLASQWITLTTAYTVIQVIVNFNTYLPEDPPCTQMLFRTETGFQTDSGCPGLQHLALALLP